MTASHQHSKRYYYALFSSVYFVQGVVWAYFINFNKIYLEENFGLPLSRIGLFGGIVLIPWLLKFLMGFLSDRVNLLGLGHRKPYILIGLALQGGLLILLPLINPATAFGLFTLVGFFTVVGMTLYDTTNDALAIDVTPPDEQGTVQGIMVGARAAGLVVLSPVLGLIARQVGWTAVFILCGVLSFLPLPLVARLREGEAEIEGRVFTWTAFQGFLQWSVLFLVLFGILYAVVIYGVNNYISIFLRGQLGIDLGTVGLVGAVVGLGTVLGGIFGGSLMDRWGTFRSAAAAVALTSLTIVLFTLVPSVPLAIGTALLFGFAFGFHETIYFALSMGFSDPRAAGTMYAIFMAVSNLGPVTGEPLMGSVAEGWGFIPAFYLFAAVNIVNLLLVAAMLRLKDEQSQQ
jgi:PAT family beta-lactamase induction signal transducer AmpG